MADGQYAWQYTYWSATSFNQSGTGTTVDMVTTAMEVGFGTVVAFVWNGDPGTVTYPSDFVEVVAPQVVSSTWVAMYASKYLTSTTGRTWSWSTSRAYYMLRRQVAPPALLGSANNAGLTYAASTNTATCPTITPGNAPTSVWAVRFGSTNESDPAGYDQDMYTYEALGGGIYLQMSRGAYQTSATASGTADWGAAGYIAAHMAWHSTTAVKPLTPLYVNGTDAYTANALTAYSRSGGTWSEGSTIASSPHSSMDTSSSFDETESDGDAGVSYASGANGGLSVDLADFALSDITDTDFSSMAGVGLRLSLVDFNTYADDDGNMQFNVVLSGPALAFAATAYHNSSLGWNISTNNLPPTAAGSYAPRYDIHLVAPDYTNFGDNDETAWNGGIFRITGGDIRNMGSDSAAIVLVDVEMLGFYVPAATGSLPPVSPSRPPKAMLVR